MRSTLLALTGSAMLAVAGPAAAVDPDFNCLNEEVASPSTPWFDNNFAQQTGNGLSDNVLRDHIPQGLTTWKNYYGTDHDLLVYSAYHEGDDSDRAWIQGVDQRDGSLTNYARIANGHAGGIAIWGDWLYVSGKEYYVQGHTYYPVRRYSLQAVHEIFAGTRADDTLEGVQAGVVYDNDFLAIEDGVLFAGRFNDTDTDKMYKYEILANGNLNPDPLGPSVRVPKKTQGLAILANHFLFSTSYGRTNRGNLYVVQRGYDALTTSYENGNLRCARVRPMNEGITMSQGRAYIAFESGSDWYQFGQDGNGSAVRPTDHLHWALRADVLDLLP